MTTQLEVLQSTSAALGLIREIETVPGDIDCPVHGTPIIEQRVETIGGWQAVLICPSFDHTCRYDPNGAPMQIEPPDADEKGPVDRGETRSTGGF